MLRKQAPSLLNFTCSFLESVGPCNKWKRGDDNFLKTDTWVDADWYGNATKTIKFCVEQASRAFFEFWARNDTVQERYVRTDGAVPLEGHLVKYKRDKLTMDQSQKFLKRLNFQLVQCQRFEKDSVMAIQTGGQRAFTKAISRMSCSCRRVDFPNIRFCLSLFFRFFFPKILICLFL